MKPERWQQIKIVLDGAVGQSSAERDAFLAAACAGDADLRREVDSLLVSHDQAGGAFLEPPWGARNLALRSDESGIASETRVGPYRVIERIGRGGMGDVFAAVRADGHYEQRVALKLVRAGLAGPDIMVRFRVERQILARLDHPNIARLLDGGTTGAGGPYLVMEFVDGVPIDTFCRDRALSVRERLWLFLDVCGAVQYAHQHFVIHRDLKPGNILVTREGVPKLLDFGIAKMLDSLGHAQETTLGPLTLDYASPEQVRGEPVSAASDVYALAVVLYQLLTGRLPYVLKTSTSGELATAITASDPDRPSVTARSHDLRGDIDAILLMALRKEPEKRYPSVERFGDDIRRHLNGLPVQARVGTWSYRATKFVRRHRGGVTAAALVAATLVAGIAVSAREARIADAQRQRADARFNDVRKLANSLLFEVHDSVARLPGATDARNLILSRSLEYLDSLAREVSGEPELTRELAAAYQRIARIQGNVTTSNLGHIDTARASYGKAIALRESLVRAGSGSEQDRFELGAAFEDFATFQLSDAGDVTSAFDFARRALAIFDRQALATPNDLRVREAQAGALQTIGWIETGEGLLPRVGTLADAHADSERALAIVDHTAAREPANDRFQAERGSVEILVGDALLKQGRRAEALDHYDHARAILAPVVARGREGAAAINDAVVLGKIGDLLFIDGDLDGASRAYQAGVLAAANLVAADPHNEFILQQQAIVTVELGHMLAEHGRVDDAVTLMRVALDKIHASETSAVLPRAVETVLRGWLGEALELQHKWADAAREYTAGKRLLGDVMAHGASPRVQSYFAMSADRLGSALAALGDADGATREYEEAERILEPLVRSAPDDYELAYALADTYTRQGIAAERAGRWPVAADRYRKSLSVWKTVPNPARASTSGLEVTLPNDVVSRLARSERARRGRAKP